MRKWTSAALFASIFILALPIFGSVLAQGGCDSTVGYMDLGYRFYEQNEFQRALDASRPETKLAMSW